MSNNLTEIKSRYIVFEFWKNTTYVFYSASVFFIIPGTGFRFHALSKRSESYHESETQASRNLECSGDGIQNDDTNDHHYKYYNDT